MVARTVSEIRKRNCVRGAGTGRQELGYIVRADTRLKMRAGGQHIRNLCRNGTGNCTLNGGVRTEGERGLIGKLKSLQVQTRSVYLERCELNAGKTGIEGRVSTCPCGGAASVRRAATNRLHAWDAEILLQIVEVINEGIVLA